MMHRILLIEKEIIYAFSVFLILFNLVSLYFIIDLLSYDEIIGYLTNGEIKSGSPRNLAFLLFVSGISNLLFVSVSFMDRVISKYPSKGLESK
jgi:hypothetical protein